MHSLLPRTNDYIFKKIFGDHRHTNILKDFLQSVLDLPAEEYDQIEIVDPHTRIDVFPDKECVLDVKLHTKSKKIIDIEMQVRSSPVMKQRVVYYLADMVKSQVKTGENYDRIQKVVSIIIAAKHNLIRDDKEYFHRYHLHDRRNDSTFTDLIEVNTLELLKLPGKSDNSKLWKWLRFFKSESEEEMKMLVQENTAISEAVDVLKELSEDERTRMIVQSREKFLQDQKAREKEALQIGLTKGRAEGRAEGERIGVEKGREEGRNEIIENMRRQGFSEEQIKSICGGLQ